MWLRSASRPVEQKLAARRTIGGCGEHKGRSCSPGCWGMVGIERTVVPLTGVEEFGIASTTLVVSFIVSSAW